MQEQDYSYGEVLLRARQATWLAGVLAVVSTLATLVRPLVAPMPPVFSVIGGANSAFLLLAWWAIGAGHVVRWAPALLLSLVTISLFPLIAISGGSSSQFAIMLPLFPLAGVMLGGLPLGAAMLVFWSLSMLGMQVGAERLPDLTGEDFAPAKASARTLWIVLTSTVGFLFGLHFDGSNRNLQARLLELVEKDPLTGAANRRGLEVALSRSLSAAARTGRWVTVMIADVDCFKRFNDHRGHAEGDLALQRIAEALMNHTRLGQDRVARFGGEEFVLVLGETDAQAARVVAEKLRGTIRRLDLRHDPERDEPLTVTIGYVSVPGGSDTTHDQLLRVADAALYEGKRGGRDRAVEAVLAGGSELVVSAA
jgi:diguanylate cyclase (GGDEF)-like protein